MVIEDGLVITGVGSTVMVNSLDSPSHEVSPFSNVGITVIVATTGVFPLFTTVKDGISPFPLAAKPMEVVLFVQE